MAMPYRLERTPLEKHEYMLYCENICKRYNPAKWILGDVDFRIRKGEFCVLLGPSGCGKSTLFRLITGQERPSYGELLIAGKPVGFPGPDRGTVDQKYTLQKNKTVLQNVMLGRRFKHGLPGYIWSWRTYRDEAIEMLRRVRIKSPTSKSTTLSSRAV